MVEVVESLVDSNLNRNTYPNPGQRTGMADYGKAVQATKAFQSSQSNRLQEMRSFLYPAFPRNTVSLLWIFC